mmetsp:Transcript_11794/g.24870  ORF Transcript_11794/g.24870 Transcript_11794/m.24870 type:complete len:272 (+) Transcript_11794:64-879(+)
MKIRTAYVPSICSKNVFKKQTHLKSHTMHDLLKDSLHIQCPLQPNNGFGHETKQFLHLIVAKRLVNAVTVIRNNARQSYSFLIPICRSRLRRGHHFCHGCLRSGRPVGFVKSVKERDEDVLGGIASELIYNIVHHLLHPRGRLVQYVVKHGDRRREDRRANLFHFCGAQFFLSGIHGRFRIDRGRVVEIHEPSSGKGKDIHPSIGGASGGFDDDFANGHFPLTEGVSLHFVGYLALHRRSSSPIACSAFGIVTWRSFGNDVEELSVLRVRF